MPDHRAAYAHRFNTRAIRRPQLPHSELLIRMTDEEFAAHLATLDSDMARNLSSITRNFGRAARAWGEAFSRREGQ